MLRTFALSVTGLCCLPLHYYIDYTRKRCATLHPSPHWIPYKFGGNK